MNRRTMLRGVLGGSLVAVGLPWLEAHGASGDGFPRRFGVFFWGNGVLPGDPDKPDENSDRWTPQGAGSGSAWSLSEQMAPLAAHKSRLTVVTGMSMKLPNIEPHGSGAAGVLSGAPLLTTAIESFTAPSIDQVIAAVIGQDSLFGSLQTAATDTLGLSFSAANARHPCEQDPFALYRRLFGDTFVEPGEDGLVSPTLGLRRSVLDAVMGDVDRLQARVSASDRARLDQHLTGIRELEQRLTKLEEDPPDLASCARPGEPNESYPDLGIFPQIGPRNDAMAELLAMALACDQTRVFAHFLSEPINNVMFDGSTDGHHNRTHDEPNPQSEVNAVTIQCMSHLASFLTALAAIPEGEGTLLDSCAVLACSEHSYGRIHSCDNMPVLIAGSAGGALKQDFHYHSSTQENVSKVMLTLQRAMGVVAGEWGVDAARVTEGLSEIEA